MTEAKTLEIYEVHLTLFGHCEQSSWNTTRTWVQKTENKIAHKQCREARVCDAVEVRDGVNVIKWAK
jgi:hypothetical protein